MNALQDDPVLHGRQPERAVLGALLDEARSARSGVLVLRGTAGIGKSALIRDTVARAQGMDVLQAVGVESESELAFAALHQLIRPVLALIDELPEPQASAIRSALGMAPPGGEDPFLVGAGVLSLLASAAEEQPLLCVVDDAHWIDAPSADALMFAARRLHADPVAVLVAAREEDAYHFPARDMPELRLGGIDPEAAGALLDEAAGAALAVGVRKRLIEASGGNPLVLLELPLALDDDQRAGRMPLSEPLPLTERLEEAFRVHAQSLPKGGQLFLLLAAADNTGDPTVVVDAARTLGIDAEEIGAVEAEGLLRVGETRIEFRHPLVRSAVYQGATFAQREAVHRGLAGVLGEARYADRRAWHLAAASLGPDEDVARELERSADQARLRGGPAAAAAALARAAMLTVDDEQRAVRQLAAAEAAAQAGQNHYATALIDAARSVATNPRMLADLEHLRGLIELREGSPSAAQPILVAAASAVEPHDPNRAAQILLDATTAAAYGGDISAQSAIGRHAARLIAQVGPSFEAQAAAGLGALWDTNPEDGRRLLEATVAAAQASEDPRRFLWAAVCAMQLGDETTARMFAARAATLARREGAVPSLVAALSRLAFAEIVEGRLASARANASEGYALAVQAGIENVASYDRALLAWVAALVGAVDDARAFADEALKVARTHNHVWQGAVATIALGELALGLGQPAEAIRHLSTLSTALSVAGHPYLRVRAAPSFVEAAARGRRVDLAMPALESFGRWVTVTGSRSQLALLARCRALVADGEAARKEFEAALALHAEAERPFDLARTEFLFGEKLRREGYRQEARDHLRIAFELFERIGAVLWAAQAQASLRASGESLRIRRPDTEDQLTPQELQIARFVATGATNKEVAAQLFLSPRTVDAHLRSIFRKLGITSRGQLVGFHLGDPADVAAASPTAVSPTRV